MGGFVCLLEIAETRPPPAPAQTGGREPTHVMGTGTSRRGLGPRGSRLASRPEGAELLRGMLGVGAGAEATAAALAEAGARSGRWGGGEGPATGSCLWQRYGGLRVKARVLFQFRADGQKKVLELPKGHNVGGPTGRFGA